MFEKLMQIFMFEKSVFIEDIDSGNAVIAENNKITIQCDAESEEKDFAELLSIAKLGEKDPLLATFYFQKNLSQEEEKFARMFYALCVPLQSAWTYKTMRKYAPSVYEKEIQQLLKLVSKLYPDFKFIDKSSDLNMRTFFLSSIAVLDECPYIKTDMVLHTKDEKEKTIWSNYLDTLFRLAKEEPDARLYLELAESANTPYKVTIENNGFRHFVVKKKEE